MTIHGKPLNWDRIRNLQNDDFGQFINEKEDSDYSCLLYTSSPFIENKDIY